MEKNKTDNAKPYTVLSVQDVQTILKELVMKIVN